MNTESTNFEVHTLDGELAALEARFATAKNSKAETALLTRQFGERLTHLKERGAKVPEITEPSPEPVAKPAKAPKTPPTS